MGKRSRLFTFTSFLHLLFTFTLFLHLLFTFTFPLHLLYATSLTLASTNDYKFVQMPTNWTPQIVGIGCGPDDTSAAIRAEDVFFLNEAVLEREFVADALSRPSTTNSQPYRTPVFALATPIPNRAHLLELGNASTNIFSGTMTSNAAFFVSQPKEIYEDPGVYFGRVSFDSLGFGHFMTNFYTAGKTQSSHRYYDFNVDARWKIYGSSAYPYPMIVRGVCTNLYHDLAANTFVAFIQQQRTGPSGITRTNGRSTLYDQWAFGFSDRDDEFTFSEDVPYEEHDYPIARFLYNYDTAMRIAVSGMRSSYVGAVDGRIVRRGQGTCEQVNQNNYHGTYCFTLPDPIVGSRLTGVKTAFAAFEMEVEEASYTNVYTRAILRHVIRRGIMPISVSRGPLDDGGCPSFTFDLDGSTMRDQAVRLFGERIKAPDELLARCAQPDYPTSPSSRTFGRQYNSETYNFSVRVPWIVGVSEIDFRAKQRSNQ